jgi:Cu+-exporting ATPase
MDIPIAIGLLTLYLYSIYNVVGNSGVGYFDSLTGFIFFLQISRIFQKKAFDSLEFQKDASDLLPLVVRKKVQDEFVLTPIQSLKENDIIHLRKNELLPCDSILISDHIEIDNSYITGESDAIRMSMHAHLYAGSRIMSQSAFFRVQKESDQSYLSILWRQAKNDSTKGASRLIDQIAPSFITAVLSIATATLAISLMFNLPQPIERVISVLIVACPCALALSAPFAFGTLSSVLAKHGFYFRETTDLEQLADIKTIIFDKTGTITQPDQKKVHNNLLTSDYNALIAAACKNSLHPLSQMIFSTLDDQTNLSSEFWEEIPHCGIRAVVNDTQVSVGSWQWLNELQTAGLPLKAPTFQSVFVSVDQCFIGHFEFSYPIRSGFKAAWQKLAQSVNCVILSGDNSAAAANCAADLGAKQSFAALSPSAKKEWIQNLPKNETPTLMFGDGMNDSSALAVSTIGVSVIENHSFFSPSADAIIEGKQLQHLPYFLKLSRFTNNIFRSCLFVSLIYNLVGLYFAITGQLTPFISGILMPLSSITIIAISFGFVQIYYHITKAELK